MKTLVYAPRVEAFVRLRNGQILDLTKDIAGGNVRRVLSEPSYAQLTLNNRNGRYTGKLAIMDAIHIRFFKGSIEYPVFTGYLTMVPVYDVYNTVVTIEAQCTLKQIVHTYWDMNSSKSIKRFIGDIREPSPLKVTIDPNMLSASPGETAIAGTGTGADIVAFANSQKLKFRYSQSSGRTDPESSGYTDCSGFCRYVYKKIANIDIGNSTHDQVFKGKEVATYVSGVPISASNLQQGDLIFYGSSANATTHVVLYIGGGKVLSHGGPGNGPNERDLNYRTNEWRQVRRHLTVSNASTWVKPSNASTSSPFGYRTHPIYGDRRLHKGLDFAASCGSPIYAARTGKVKKTYYDSSGGNMIILDHGNGLETWYLHIMNGGTLVTQGQQVNAGQQIAKVGTTGSSTGCHLHFEVRQNGVPQDPAPLLSGASTSTGTVNGPATGTASATDFWKLNPNFDPRTQYWEKQAREDREGVRLKGFLEEVCGWPSSNIAIELFPERLARLVQKMNIVEGAKDPDEQMQIIYRLLMGDTFAQTPEQSVAAVEGGFSGSEGGGDRVFTQTMYGIGMVVSQLDYAHKKDLLNGDGAYGLSMGMKSKTKAAQDAAMLKELKGYGNPKNVAGLAQKYGSRRGLSGDILTNFVNNVKIFATKAPSSSGPKTTVPTNPVTPSLDSGIDLFLKGMLETESSGRYDLNGGQRDKWVGLISGGYQMGEKEWNNYGGYKYPYLAPPAVQDAHAKQLFSQYYNKYREWDKAAAHHHYPAWANDRSKWDRLIPGNPISLNTYVKRVLRYMTGTESLDGTSGASQASMLSETLNQSFYSFFRSAVAMNRTPSLESERLSGEKALMNDESAMNFVKLLVRGGLREFQSDPYGNFTAFYPDYFGWYSPNAPLVKIQDVELRDFKIRATDQIYSHVYVVDGSTYPDLYNMGSSISDSIMKQAAEGVVTLENTELIGSLLGMKPSQAAQFLTLYGARPYVETHHEILNKSFAKLYSLQLFLERWTGQYNTSCDITFMPELWPGTRASIADTGVGVYVKSVTHNFSYSSGFTTTFIASCPQELSTGTVIDSATGLYIPESSK